MEDKGVPAAVICTEVFTETAYAVASAHGIPYYPYAVVPHPISIRTDTELSSMANSVADRVIKLLTEQINRIE